MNTDLRGFAWIVLPASLGGWLWSLSQLPLGWLMGAALVSGVYAMSGRKAAVPKWPHRAALTAIGSGVGLALTPEAAAAILSWAPQMLFAGGLGIALAALFTPTFSRLGNVNPATAFFSLLPGGVIEMAEIGGANGAERTTIAALHALRVGMVVGLLPLALYALFPHGAPEPGHLASGGDLILALIVGGLGGLLGARLGIPAAWLLGAVISVGLLAGLGLISGALPKPMLAAAQVLVGISLGLRFERRRLASIPRALSAGTLVLLAIIVLMAGCASLLALWFQEPVGALILAFSIGGMAEMVLTAKALHQEVALVAAFQAVRAVLVNLTAGTVWTRLVRPYLSPHNKGE